MRLVVGDCGVPYLLNAAAGGAAGDAGDAGDAAAGEPAGAAHRWLTDVAAATAGAGRRVKGELYWVDAETLAGLDEYEAGLSTGLAPTLWA